MSGVERAFGAPPAGGSPAGRAAGGLASGAAAAAGAAASAHPTTGAPKPHESDAERDAAAREADLHGADLGSEQVAAGRGRALVLAYGPVRAALDLSASAHAPLRVVLVDGRSGSGKTTLAADLAGALDLRVVHMDDLYEGWEGLRAGSDYAWQRILEPLSRGETARWNRWDWHASARAEEHALAPGEAFVLEGCGSLSRRAAGIAGLAIWLELDEEERHRRAAERDGDDSWWAGWRAQEDAFYAAERSSSLAGLTL